MKTAAVKNKLYAIGSVVSLFLGSATMVVFVLFLFSFNRLNSYGNEFLKQLGISKEVANEKLVSGFLGGSFDEYGLKKAKTIALGSRAAIVKEVVAYAREYTASAAFLAEYKQMREKNKPTPFVLKSPDAMQKEMIEEARKGVVEAEASYKKADASMKPLFENILNESKKNLANAENPNNKNLAAYKKNYAQAVKDADASNKRQLDDWEREFPANHQQYIKRRLLQFLDETSTIDFNATLVERNGIKYFTNNAYEAKSNRWKMGFRAGQSAVETARALVSKWVEEIN